MKTTVVTIPGMILEEDLNKLRHVSELQYIEINDVTEDSLAQHAEGVDILMLNFDVIVNGFGELSPSFWSRPELSNLKAVAFDMTGVDWASPAQATASGLMLLNIPHY